MTDQWSRLSVCCEDPKLAPDGPIRIFVEHNDGLITVSEHKVTSYSDRAQQLNDGCLARMSLTRGEAQWLIDTLCDALEEMAREPGFCMWCHEPMPDMGKRACPDQDDPGGPCMEHPGGTVQP